MRFAVNNSNQIVALATDGANPVDGYYYEIATVSGKYQHTIELFIAKETLGTAWNAERMQLNYAWCIANEKAHVIDCSNARYDSHFWWGQARIGGVANADWQWGSGYTLPANLFATKAGLVTTANENPVDEQIDGVASEKYGTSYVETGSWNKAHVKVQGYVGTDGLYFLFTINHKNKSSFADGWADNDNIETHGHPSHLLTECSVARHSSLRVTTVARANKAITRQLRNSLSPLQIPQKPTA